MLDGISGLAVLGVMAVHAEIRHLQWGYLGVDVFFTLSGFLITTVLLEEWSERGTVDFKKFYARRALRLLPALSMLLIASLLPVNPISMVERIKAALVALFYMSNWVRAFAPDFKMKALGHTWSLSMEEQFYLLWPILLMTMLRFEAVRKRIIPILSIAAIGCMSYRAMLWTAGRTPERLYNGLDTRADALLTGCVLSLILGFGIPGVLSSPRPIFKVIALILAAPLLVMVFRSQWNDPFMFMAGYSTVSIASAAVIFWVLHSSSELLSAILGFRPLVWTGRISYGLYLWHYPLFEFVRGLRLPDPIDVLCMFGGVFALAALSFYGVERPFLRLKQRFKVPVPGTPSVLIAHADPSG